MLLTPTKKQMKRIKYIVGLGGRVCYLRDWFNSKREKIQHTTLLKNLIELTEYQKELVQANRLLQKFKKG